MGTERGRAAASALLERRAVVDHAAVHSEAPDHLVEISRAFWLAATPVTVGQFRTFVAATGYRTEGERDGSGAYCYLIRHRKWALGVSTAPGLCPASRRRTSTPSPA